MDPETSTTELPTDLSALSPEQLDQALTSARDEAAELGSDIASLTDEQVTRLEALADFADAVEAETSARAEAAQERAARAEAAQQRLAAPPTDGGEPGEGDEEGAGDGDGDEAPAEPTDGQVITPEAVAAAVTAALQATGIAPTAARPMRLPVNPAPRDSGTGRAVSLIAAADVGDGIQAGSELNGVSEVARAFISRSRSFPEGPARERNVRHQFSVATVRRNFAATTDGLFVGNPDFADAQSVLREASRERRLPGGSLVAAGGWCAPSETMYGLASPETLDGILDLPTIGVERGGINYTPGPDFADIYTSAGFFQTEAQAIAGTTKPCVEVDCPDFSEVRLDAVGICVKAPLLTRRAYPELIERWLSGTDVANAHKVNGRVITAMRNALGTALAPTLTGTPITWALLTMLELTIETQRQAYRLDDGESLEVIAPRWLRAAIRADLANRNGIGAESVTNAQIAQHFADRGAAIQWVLGYDELSSPLTRVTFPTTVEVMVYPAGTFVKGQVDVVNLSTVYDTADLQTNVYTAAFIEDGVLVAKMQHGGKRITLPVNVTGMLGAPQLDDNWGTAQAETAGAAAS